MGSKKPAKPAQTRKKPQRRKVATPTTSAASGRKRPAPGGIPTAIPTTQEVELAEFYASRARARYVLRTTGSYAKALAEFGVTQREKKGSSATTGRIPRTDQELEHIAGRYINFRTAPADRAPAYARVERKDLIMGAHADWLRSLRDGQPCPDFPTNFYFFPDCAVPMEHADALRNVQLYLGVGSLNERSTWQLINQGMRVRAALGLDTLKLPPRPRQ